MYLVDTNVLSEARRGSREARTWFQSVDPNTVYLSIITLGEIMRGIALKRRTDARAAASLTVCSNSCAMITPREFFRSAIVSPWNGVALLPSGRAEWRTA